MPNPLFSRYSQGENRVTASILAVFERISFALVERILQILCEEPNLPLLVIKNQIKSDKSIPDGAIQASFPYLIETKVVQNSVVKKQLEDHLEALKLSNFYKKKLLVLTPDYETPVVIKELNSDLIVWASFNALNDAIAEITATDESWLTSDLPLPSEQERFLLRELVQMLLAERLINSGKSDAVLIVPARSAIQDYRSFSVYVCQPNRSFQPVEYIGFYHGGVIDQYIPKIIGKPIEDVTLTEEAIEEAQLSLETKQDLLQLVKQLKKHSSSRYGVKLKVFFLSSPTSPDTIKLTQAIKNDLKNEAGRPYAFTQGQRYVPLSALRKNPATTTELLMRGE
ncbi:MAG: hypothetical protein KME42_17340 [Tildeniella nuda ZEHNDER 1965/U140]|jgi:hypothetical protein|nr:hypothetical protein [Tildeniella nuda ZEHNDER 1965/U140]